MSYWWRNPSTPGKLAAMVCCLIALSGFVSPKEPIMVFLIGDSTMAAKEPKAHPQTGWGTPFASFFDETVKVENRAVNGRSTRTFIEEKRWQPVVDQLKEGDYVLIQFGHNDEVPTKKSYTTEADFKKNLVRFVQETRSRKAHPVLITPVARRKFDAQGQIEDTHAVYSGLVAEVAREEHVPLIDLNKRSRELLQKTGIENSKLLFMHLRPGEHPNYPDGQEDNTHFSQFGARKIALCVLEEIRLLRLNLVERLVGNERPNILWITSEDNAPMLGCYGDSLAKTPNLDKLAAGGFLYTHAFAPAAVCSPSRNSLITGVYANSSGHQHMRSEYRKSDLVRLYPEYLREAGYYCTNNFKEDFNIDPAQTKNTWDELGTKAHYKNRAKGQPFFAIFNTHLTHESSLHIALPKKPLRHRPMDVKLPPYHPDTPELRRDWAQYYDNVEDMDTWVGDILDELEKSGEAENTIVFYYSDHAGVLPRSKRFIYDTGTHIPFIVHIPEKFKHLWPALKPGMHIDRLVSLIDLPPTLLSMIDTPIPGYMQGNAFLGPQKKPEQPYVFHFRDRQEERYDLYRAVRDKKFRYIRNYMPHRLYGMHSEYSWLSQAYRSWESACKTGNCNETQRIFWGTKPVEELYDTENDPWEVQNLAANPRYRPVLDRMRNACRDWMIRIRDTGFIHEGELVGQIGDNSAYDYMRAAGVNMEALVDAAELASRATENDLPALLNLLSADDAALRYWGATGLAVKPAERQKQKVIAALIRHIDDPSPNTSVAVAEALCRLGETDRARPALLKALRSGNMAVRLHALNVIDVVDDDHSESRAAVIEMVKRSAVINRNQPDLRMAKWLFEKWGVDARSSGVDLNWSWTN